MEEIDKVLAPLKMGTVVGTYPQTGVGGLTLGGGYGWLGRMHGYTVDNFLQAEVVLLTGEIVTANDEQHADLMWGLRGGSGNFGIVTKFTFRVHRLPPYCHFGTIVYLAPTLASRLEICLGFDKLFTTLPADTQPLLAFPAGAPVVPILVAQFGSEAETSALPQIQALQRLGGWFKVENSVKPASYHADVQTATTALVMSGHIYHTLIQFGSLDSELPSACFEQLLAFTAQSLPSSMKQATLLVFPMGGALSTNDPTGEKTCLASAIRKARYFGILEAYWKPEFGDAGKEAARTWCHGVTDILKPHCSENLRYAAADNYNNDPLYKDQAGYGSVQYQRLGQLKAKYDPHNLLRNNMNILPAP